MLAVGFVSLAIALAIALPVALRVSVPSHKIVLMVRAVALVVDVAVAVAVEAGAAVQRLAIHLVSLPEAAAWVLVPSYDGTEARLYGGPS
jgi:ABC-type arginine/histidine transport system permease subunit